jgi:hypothetical protein
MSYEIEAAKKDVEINVVVKVGSEYYSIKQVDSGLVIEDDNICVDVPNVNGTSVDIRDTTTPIGTFSFQLQEDNDLPVISSRIMLDGSQWLGKEVTAYVGFITGTFDFSQYLEVARTNITGVTKIRNGYSITSREAASLIDVEAYNLNDISTVSILAGSTTVDITDASAWPSTGTIEIEGEFCAYTSKVGNTLSGLARAQFGSTAIEHDLGAKIYLVTIKVSINPIDFLLQMILSKNGDLVNEGTYDLIPFGPGLDSNLVDIASFESIRDNFFSTELHTYLVFNKPSLLKLLEDTVLSATNTRLISNNGKIGLTLLDQINLNDDIPVIDESTIIGTPTWGLTVDKIINAVEVFYNYNYITKKYETKETFKDLDSIALYGEKKALSLELIGVTGALDGNSIATDRAGRLLSRLSTARGKIDLTAQIDTSIHSIGAAVQLLHRFLPQQGGTLGFSDRLEVMSRDLDFKSATVKFKLEFTSYTGIRIAFIAPSPKITALDNQKTFTVNDASLLRVGYVMQLFQDGPLDLESNPTEGSYLPDLPNVIESIVGNIVTMRDDFISTLALGLWFKFADYDNVNELQRARFAFVGQNAGFFFDGSKTYQVVF